MGVCFGLYVVDFNDTCCSNLDIQRTTGELGALDVCLPELFKWSLTMTATLGTYEDDVFVPSLDSTDFTIGTHYLSTDGLDILEDMSYSDIVKPPSTVEQSIYFYTSHPEWGYSFGNDFIQEYKFHNLDKLISSSGIYPRWAETLEGIEWNGSMTSDYYGEKFIKFTFSLESEQSIYSNIELIFNDETLVYSEICEDELFFSDYLNEECNIVREDFEYIIPITFQGIGAAPLPFSILIGNTFIYENAIQE